MGIFKNFIRQTKSLFKKEDNVTGIVVKKLPLTYVAPCGTVVEKLRLTIDIEEGKEAVEFDPLIGRLYWPSDDSDADGPGIRDIPNYKNKDKIE